MYSATVREYWEKYRPRELAQMTDPEAFIQAKGREIQIAVLRAEQDLEETLGPVQDYQGRVGQLKQIRATAREQALKEVLPPPETAENGTTAAGEETPSLDPRLTELLAIQDELNPVRLEDD